MLNLYIAYCQKLYTQHCHFLYIVNLLITSRPLHFAAIVVSQGKMPAYAASYPQMAASADFNQREVS